MQSKLIRERKYFQYLIFQLRNTQSLIMVDQNQIDEVILDNNYQNRDCKSEDCGIEIGKLLGIKNIIVTKAVACKFFVIRRNY